MTTKLPPGSGKNIKFTREDLAKLRLQRRINHKAKLNNVFIIGGTHGNETNGVYLAKYFMKSPDVTCRSNFQTSVVLSNDAAVKNNSRYVEVDMNRCFLLNDLVSISEKNNNDDNAVVNNEKLLLEQKRAYHLNKHVLGPKESINPKADMIFDLHNTTANTGVALMLAPDDIFAHEIAAFLSSIDSSVKICNWTPLKNTLMGDWGLLPTLGRSGMTFEVGPSPWGNLNGKTYDQSRKLLLSALDYIEKHNENILLSDDGQTNPTIRKKKVIVNIHQGIGSIMYPKDENGEINAMVHPDIQDKDFIELKDGNPLFLNLDGTTEYFYKKNYKFINTQKGDDEEKIFPFFINESAYYEGGVAMVIARRKTIEIGIHDVPVSSLL